MKISVIIHTYNAQEYLLEVLKSVKDFDEIIVCDMESTDNSVQIAKDFGCKVIYFPKKNYTIPEPARDFAIHSASNDWVLVVDSDEIVPKELKDYVYEYLNREDKKDALYVPRDNTFLGKSVKGTFPDYQLRFFNQTKATWPPYIHAVPTIDGTIGHIPAKYCYAFIHKGFTVRSQITKMNNYTDNDLVKRKRQKASLLDMIFSPLYHFVQCYIFKGGIFSGRRGFIRASMDAISKFYYLAKVYERSLNSKK